MKLKQSIFLVGMLILASAFTYKTYFTPQDETLPIEVVEPGSWTNFETATQLAKKDQKKILVDVYTDWCKWCKVMDKQTFSETSVSTYLAKNYHLVKFNAEQKEAINFKGKNFSFKSNGRRGYHEFAEEILDGKLAYPSLVIFDSELNKLEVVRGFKNPQDLMQILSGLEAS